MCMHLGNALVNVRDPNVNYLIEASMKRVYEDMRRALLRTQERISKNYSLHLIEMNVLYIVFCH